MVRKIVKIIPEFEKILSEKKKPRDNIITAIINF